MSRLCGGILIACASFAALALLLAASSCSGGGSVIAPAPGSDEGTPASQAATAADFVFTIQPETYAVTDEVREIAMTVDDQGESVVVRVDIRGAVEMHAFFASLDFDPERFDPVNIRMHKLEVPDEPPGPHIELIGAHEYGRRWLLDYRT